MVGRVTNYVKTPVFLTGYHLIKLKSNEPCSIRIDPKEEANCTVLTEKYDTKNRQHVLLLSLIHI